MLSSAQLNQLQRAALSSVACERATRLPAGLTVSQWALESRWGAHQPGNNCFGIKAYDGCFGTQSLQTFEVVDGVRAPVSQSFAVFPSLDACFQKHAALFTRGRSYQKAWAQYLTSPELVVLIRQIAPIYATDPDYAKVLLQILTMPDVRACLAECRST